MPHRTAGQLSMNKNRTQVSTAQLPGAKSVLRRLALLTLATLSMLYVGKARAETITLQAITDFSVIDAGDVPFYRDTADQRNVLAINAGNENYRSRFAMATTEFDGSAGFYDLELTTLGELDGDCIYQIVINDQVMGTAVNTIAITDYEVQTHQFNDIYIPAGATVGVTAVAVSNGLIPENDAFAFARGRWRTLELTSDDGGDDFTPVVDLSLDARYLMADSAAGSNTITVELDVSSGGSTPTPFTATAPLVSVVLPDGLVLGSSDDCSAFGYRVYCDLPDMPNDSTETISFSLEPSEAGDFTLAASVIADQRELNIENNLRSLAVSATYDESFDPNLGAALGENLNANSGGGSASWYLLLLMSLTSVLRRRR